MWRYIKTRQNVFGVKGLIYANMSLKYINTLCNQNKSICVKKSKISVKDL